MVIDLHSHTMPDSVVRMLEAAPDRFGARVEVEDGVKWLSFNGRRRGHVKPRGDYLDYRLEDMDTLGIDVQVLAPRPFLIASWPDAGWAAELAAAMNEGLAGMAAKSDRFWAVGQLPLQSPERSLEEIEHLEALGLRGVEVGAHLDGLELDDESLEPVWARLSELEMVVFVHPLNLGYLPRMEPYHLSNLIGNPLDTTIALSRLMLSGVLVRHPGIRFYFAHAGGFMPYLFGRIDHSYRSRGDTSAVIDVLPSSLLARCCFDTITHSEPALRYLIEAMGSEHVVVGTDYPADMNDRGVVGTLSALGLSGEALARVEHENAERLFARS